MANCSLAHLKEFMPEGIRINQITAGHAKEFHEKLKAEWMATTTIHKRIQFAQKFMHDAVDWKIIDENPFCKVKTQKISVNVNEFVPREVVDRLMKKANPIWQVILGKNYQATSICPFIAETANDPISPFIFAKPDFKCNRGVGQDLEFTSTGTTPLPVVFFPFTSSVNF